VLSPTAKVIVAVPAPEAGIVLGVNVTDVPEGTPEAVSTTELLNPPLATVVMLEVALLP
jgi:hypothetical protein